MQRTLLSVLLTCLILSGCKTEERLLTEQEIRFSMQAPASKGTSGGRTSTAEPKSVLVTIKDSQGNVVFDRKELALYKFGDGFLSIPVMLKSSGSSHYRLSEFFVVDADNTIRYITPIEGSTHAHLVSDPLDIDFAVTKDVVTTVTPEVLEIDENSVPEEFGYGEFGFKIIKTITPLFTSFIKGANNSEITTSHLKIEGLGAITGTDTTVLWTYDTTLQARTHAIKIREASLYRITATKSGYHTWRKATTLSTQQEVRIEFASVSTNPVDIYIGGNEMFNNVLVATYWKNEVPVHVSTARSSIYQLFIAGNDVYATGRDESTERAFYWKNTERILLDHPLKGSATGLYISGNDVYVTGSLSVTDPGANGITHRYPVYWKNGVLIQLTDMNEAGEGSTTGITVDGSDVYVSGILYHPHTGALWKNNVIERLAVDGKAWVNATGIKIHNHHRYVMGLGDGANIGYWRDGQHSSLGTMTPPTAYLTGYGLMALDGDDVFLIGSVGGKRYWKNQQEIVLSPELTRVELYGIDALNGSVYLAGQYLAPPENGVSNIPGTYWIDGVHHELPNRNSTAYAIQVRPK
ncbi:MAG: hypothetical protein HOP08_05680 [Cyclobacteriaceae bacterium]|nr:hypothetical protein [Cyclobacteriaceae bacterium]